MRKSLLISEKENIFFKNLLTYFAIHDIKKYKQTDEVHYGRKFS